MSTECSGGQLQFQGLGGRRVEASYDGGQVTSDAGLLLVREADALTGLCERMAACFKDHRREDRIEHTVAELLRQRLMGLVAGYEDLNDHDQLRNDVLFAVVSGKLDPTGEERERERDRGHPLAASSTLNRLELTPQDADRSSRYKKVVYDATALDELLVEVFLDAYAQPPNQIVLDLDATDDPLHGHQEGRFFHGYYDCYCYLPLYIFCGGYPLCARLRQSDKDGADGSLQEVQRIVTQVRKRWPKVHIVLRADSGFARDYLMSWCEKNRVDYVFGLARNERLGKQLRAQFVRLAADLELGRLFHDFRYQTLKSWSRERRVIGKAELVGDKENPRFIVTSLSEEQVDAAYLYERVYCARGDMENRIKEQQLGMFADRTSTATMRANQLRLYMSTFAYLLVHVVRTVGLAGTELENAQCSTLRVRLFKLGAVVRVSVRRVYFALSSAHPAQDLFRQALHNLRAAPS